MQGIIKRLAIFSNCVVLPALNVAL